MDPETFFPAPSEPADAAIALCRTCDVQGPCLAWALEVGDCHGVWGATTPRERRAMLVAWRADVHDTAGPYGPDEAASYAADFAETAPFRRSDDAVDFARAAPFGADDGVDFDRAVRAPLPLLAATGACPLAAQAVAPREPEPVLTPI